MNILLKSRLSCNNLSNVCHAFLKRTLTTAQVKEFYSVLEVDKNSTPKEIKESFLKLSKTYHPDNKLTGSHAKFVKLKEAYDALKHGPPKIEQTDSHKTNPYSYDYENVDLSHRGHARYREQNQEYSSRYERRSPFGGPYADSSSPWENLVKDRRFRQSRQSYERYGRAGGTLFSVTILFGAIAWIVIYSSVLLIWDYNSSLRHGYYNLRNANKEDLKNYRDHLIQRRKELNLDFGHDSSFDNFVDEKNVEHQEAHKFENQTSLETESNIDIRQNSHAETLSDINIK